MKKVLMTLIGAALLVGFSTSPALADKAVFESTLVGSTPGVIVRGVPSGGAPWMVERGEARLDADGRLRVRVEGLLLLNGTVGPVRAVVASLTCEGSNVVATTGAVPLSAAGDARIDEMIELPAECVGPIVLVRRDGPGPWFAATGF